MKQSDTSLIRPCAGGRPALDTGGAMRLARSVSLLLVGVACSGAPVSPPGEALLRGIPVDAPGAVTAPPGSSPVPPPADVPDLVFISLDTTRADALGVYGEALPVTPRQDALARRGVRFAWAIAQSPTTLASHATVFTGLDPHGTRIVRNGFALDSAVETVAERLAARGYDTLGVIGASALARPMNIDQGFRIWDEELGVEVTHRHEAPANAVTDRALALLARRTPGKPLFLFVHYYDAHAPYGAPEPFLHRFVADGRKPRYSGREGELNKLGDANRAGHADPADLAEVRANYLGEVAFVDQEVGRLVDHLDPGRTVIVVFGDHGEALGDSPERRFGHGPELDLVATHVPLYLVGRGVPAGVVVDAPIALQDLPATALSVIGVTEPFGESLDRSAWWATVPSPAGAIRFLEATQPDVGDGGGAWNNLRNERGALQGTALLLTNPLRQSLALYAVAPGQPRMDDPLVAARLTGALRDWDVAAPAWRDEHMSTETREGLKALGYLE